MKAKPTGQSWERDFQKKFVTHVKANDGSKMEVWNNTWPIQVKAFISSLIKAEREAAEKRGYEKAEKKLAWKHIQPLELADARLAAVEAFGEKLKKKMAIDHFDTYVGILTKQNIEKGIKYWDKVIDQLVEEEKR